MPSATRPTMATEVPVKGEKRVGFAPDIVSSVSRPVNVDEHRAIYDFECHARNCAICHRPYEVYKNGEQLCKRGHTYAQDVAEFLYNQDGETFSTTKEDHKTVRVEVKENYDEVRSLLKAIERSLRHRRRAPFVSMDRSYYVSPRGSDRHHHAKVKIEQPKRPLSGEIVDWPKPTIERRATVDVHTSRSSKRGSLYDADMAQHKRDSIKYKVEIREPSKGSSGYYR